MRPLALTMGDPAGIGGEITLASWTALRTAGPAFFAIDDPARLAAIDPRVPLAPIAEPEEAQARFAEGLPVLPLPLAVPATPGKPDRRNAPAVIAAIERAAALTLAGRAGAVVTNPISKSVLYGAGFAHPGHTEFLAALTGGAQPVMMLVGPELRVIPVTVHVSLRAALAMLSTELIVRIGRIAAGGLVRDFGIARPRLAVAGLNPHAGEEGALGSEDREIIAPAVAALAVAGIDATGPYPPDTMFTPAARVRYDGALCMYHDQALIPLKTLDMAHGVNVTLGLPIVRTSPDHGTAFDIAGRGSADPSSLIAALRLAAAMAAQRERAA